MTFLCVLVCCLILLFRLFFLWWYVMSSCPSVSGELSPCRVLNGGCGDLCLLTPDGTVNCSCRGERILLDDNRCVCKFHLHIHRAMPPSDSQEIRVALSQKDVKLFCFSYSSILSLSKHHYCYRLSRIRDLNFSHTIFTTDMNATSNLVTCWVEVC